MQALVAFLTDNPTLILIVIALILAVIGVVTLILCYQKVEQGQALIRTGISDTKVSFGGIVVLPVVHKAERMDISLKRIEVTRKESNGILCKDNIRVDVTVNFFLRVNKDATDVLLVAQTIGCQRASNAAEIRAVFDARFSEALKTIAKKFDFTALYDERDKFKAEVAELIGTKLEGFTMVNCSIDYMEQTQLSDLNPANILDAEGIKKIAYLTAAQMEEANKIEREKELTIKRQDTETEKQKLELDLEIETERGKQKREIETHQFRERAETAKVEEEERLKASQARILTEEKAAVARQQSLLQTNKAQYEREMANLEEQAQLERIRDQTAQKRDRDAALALIERERATIEQQKVVEAEKNSLTLVRQKQKDAEALAQADLEKKIAILKAEEEAQVELKEAESAAKRQEIDSKTAEMVAQQQATALKLLASAKAEEAAAAGLGEVQVIKAKLQVETEGIQARHTADANGLREKAEALKLLDKGGQAHEEFKMRLEADHSVALAQLETQKLVAREQAIVLAEALKHAKIDIVGGEAAFLERVVSLVGHGKAIDSMMQSSSALRDVKDTFFKGDHQQFRSALRSLVSQLTLDAKDLKDVTIAAAIGTLLSKSKDEETTQKLTDLLTTASRAGLVSQPVHSLLHSDHH